MENVTPESIESRDDGSVVVKSPSDEPTVVEDLAVDRDTPVYVSVVKVVGGQPEPLTDDTTGERKEFPPNALPEVIVGVQVIITPTDDVPINAEDVSGKICIKGESIVHPSCVFSESSGMLCGALKGVLCSSSMQCCMEEVPFGEYEGSHCLEWWGFPSGHIARGMIRRVGAVYAH